MEEHATVPDALKVGLVGIGFMGRVHFSNYLRLQNEGYPLQLAAVCDIDEKKFQGLFVEGNLNDSLEKIDFSPYRLYRNIDDMLENEELKVVDVAVPTYLHTDFAIKAMQKGCHVLCEKPMALCIWDAERMVRVSREMDKKLMIAQCLRFWPAYEYLKQCADSGRYGKVLAAMLFRGGKTPQWSYENWMLDEEKSGGSLLDLHVHDIDMINWLFGKPEAVSCIGINKLPGSGYDIVSTHYRYSDGKVVHAQDDWALGGDYGFDMTFRVNFERGNLIFEKGVLRDNPADGPGFTPDLPEESVFIGKSGISPIAYGAAVPWSAAWPKAPWTA